MKRALGAVFLAVNLVSVAIGYSGPLVALVLAIVCLAFLHCSRKNGQGMLSSMVELLCYTWSCSWRSILGGSFAETPVSWFYLIGICIVLYVILFRRVEGNPVVLALMLALIGLGLVPLFISPDFSDALTEYTTLLFFLIVAGAIHFAGVSIREEEYKSVLRAIVNANLLTSVAIICQYVIQVLWNYNFVRREPSVLIGSNRLANSLMFGDISSATIFLGIAIMVVVIDVSEFKHPFLASLCIAAGMTLSSARTGFVALVLTFLLYIVSRKRLRIGTLVVGLLTCMTGVVAFAAVRQIDSLGEMLRDSERLRGYATALQIWLEHPLLGVGLGDRYLSRLMQMPIPHFSLLKILTQSGLVYSVPLVALLAYYYRVSKRSPYGCGRFMIIQSFIGSLFIPDLFAARFFTIVLAAISLERKVARRETSTQTSSMRENRHDQSAAVRTCW